MRKLFIKIDEQGYFLCDELITDLAQVEIDDLDNPGQRILSPEYVDPVTNPIPEGMKVVIGVTPKRENGQWVEIEIPVDIEKLRVDKFGELEKSRESMIYDKFDFEGTQFACDSDAREDINDVERAYNYSVQKQKEHEEAMALLPEEERSELPDEYKFEGRWWFIYGGASMVFITKDKILDFCIQPSRIKDAAWSKFALLNNQRIAAESKEEIEAIVWINGA